MAFACQVLLEIEVMVQLYYVSRTLFFHHCLMDSPLACLEQHSKFDEWSAASLR